MKTVKKYTRELKRQFGYLATWLPGTPMELGDIGVLKRNEFTKISNLSDFGIEFETEPDDTKADIEHTSQGAVSLTIKASGAVAPQGSSLATADAGISVGFSKENAILFKANGTTSPSIRNQIKLGSQIIKLFQDGKWDKDWAVITEVVNASSATILISSSSEGTIDLKAKGEVESAKIDIADANLGLELKFSKDLATNIVAQSGLTPLFKASRIKSRIFAPPVFQMNKTDSLMNRKEMSPMDMITPSIAKKHKDILMFGEADFEYDSE